MRGNFLYRRLLVENIYVTDTEISPNQRKAQVSRKETVDVAIKMTAMPSIKARFGFLPVPSRKHPLPPIDLTGVSTAKGYIIT